MAIVKRAQKPKQRRPPNRWHVEVEIETMGGALRTERSIGMLEREAQRECREHVAMGRKATVVEVLPPMPESK